MAENFDKEGSKNWLVIFTPVVKTHREDTEVSLNL